MNVDGNPRFLPQEIITNILQRLPVKSLLRFQCVCKHWKNLIKTPSFIQSHLTHQNPCLLIEHAPSVVDPFNLYLFDCEMQVHYFENPPTIDSFVEFHIVGSCNGLICVVNYNLQPPTSLLWNPATREVRQMPVTFDDLPNCWHFGFGFSLFVNDYKVVRVSRPDVIDKVEVYSLRTGSWKDIGFDNIEDFAISDDGVTINGVVFWYGFRLGSHLIGTDRNGVIISFDLATEVFTVMPPPALVSHDVGVKLAVYEDKLALISLHWMVNPQCVCINFGVMEEGVRGSSEERWSLRRKYVHYLDRVQVQAGTIWRNQVVYIDYELPRIIGETEVEMENVEPKWGIHFINVTTNEHKLFATRGGRRYGFSSVYNYVESLVQIGNIQL